ncbi:hypothetical protein E4U53_001381 [Claviceps sorghi]|nr:hypothetical protein E4U53_001381 [Claviceps sorghi]
MVEDELLHTARRFTTHLHRAEYMRLKEQTRSRNEAAIRAMERPVVRGAPTSVARRTRAARVRDGKQQGVTGEAVPPWVGTSLHGLMEHRGGEGEIVRRAASRGEVRTRAAAGCTSRGGPATPSDGGRVTPMRPRGDGEAQDSDGEAGHDDPFGVHTRRVRRMRSREQRRRLGGREREGPTRTPDTIPSFL